MINWSHVYEGWKNHLVPSKELKELISQTAEERMEICNVCEMNSHNIKGKRGIARCTICTCPLVALTKCLSCNCSMEFPKWEAVITENQEQEFNDDE